MGELFQVAQKLFDMNFCPLFRVGSLKICSKNKLTNLSLTVLPIVLNYYTCKLVFYLLSFKNNYNLKAVHKTRRKFKTIDHKFVTIFLNML